MLYQFSKKEISKLDNKDWVVVQNLLSKPISVTICDYPEIRADLLMTLGIILLSHKVALMRIHIYHCKKQPVEIRDWCGKFPKGELCPICNSAFNKNTQYDIEIITKYPIKFND